MNRGDELAINVVPSFKFLWANIYCRKGNILQLWKYDQNFKLRPLFALIKCFQKVYHHFALYSLFMPIVGRLKAF